MWTSSAEKPPTRTSLPPAATRPNPARRPLAPSHGVPKTIQVQKADVGFSLRLAFALGQLIMCAPPKDGHLQDTISNRDHFHMAPVNECVRMPYLYIPLYMLLLGENYVSLNVSTANNMIPELPTGRGNCTRRTMGLRITTTNFAKRGHNITYDQRWHGTPRKHTTTIWCESPRKHMHTTIDGEQRNENDAYNDTIKGGEQRCEKQIYIYQR